MDLLGHARVLSGDDKDLHDGPCDMLDPMTLPKMMTLAAVATLALSLGACSPVEKQVDPVGAAELTAEVTERLEAEIDVPFEVECAQELAATVWATATCDMTSPATSVGDVTVLVTVTAVDVETGIVSFDITAEPVLQPSEGESAPETEESSS